MNLRIAHFAFYLLFAAYVSNVLMQKSYADTQATEKQSEHPSPSQPDSFLCDLHADVEVAEFKLKSKEALTPTPTLAILSANTFDIKDAQRPSKIYQLLNTPPPERAFSI